MTATANSTAGSYSVTATTAGAEDTAVFALTNTFLPHSAQSGRRHYPGHHRRQRRQDQPLREAIAHANSIPGGQHNHLLAGRLRAQAPRDDHTDPGPADPDRCSATTTIEGPGTQTLTLNGNGDGQDDRG